MRKFVYLLFVIVAGLFVASCSDESSSTEPSGNEPSTDIMPLEVGNEWVYKNLSYDELGSVSGESLDTLKLIQELTVADYKYYKTQYGEESFNFIGLKDDGLYRLNEAGEEIYMVAKYPCVVGDVYEQLDEYASKTFTVLAVDELVETPAGSFKTIKYHGVWKDENTGDIFNDIYYYSVKAGMIKNEYYMENSGEKGELTELILQSYNLK